MNKFFSLQKEDSVVPILTYFMFFFIIYSFVRLTQEARGGGSIWTFEECPSYPVISIYELIFIDEAPHWMKINQLMLYPWVC